MRLCIVWLAAGPLAAQGIALPIEKAPVVALAAGDADGDGRIDLLIAAEDHPLQMLRGKADGAFGPAASVLPGEPWKARALALADLDGDGDLDVLAGGVDVLTRMWLNNGGGEFVEASGCLPEAKLWVTGIATGDLDGDGDIDAVLSNFSGRDALYRNDGGGRFRDDTAALPPTFTESSTVLLADLDGDADLDVIVGQRPDATGRGGRNLAARNLGAKFDDATEAWMPSSTGNTTALALADVDGDGLADLITAVRGLKPREGARSSVHRREAKDGRFLGSSPKRFPGEMVVAQAVAAGDIDGDGDADLVFGNDGRESLWLNDGKGVFTAGTDLPPVSENTRALLLVDADGDRDLDVITGNAEGTVRLFVNRGAGNFSAPTAGAEPAENADGGGASLEEPAPSIRVTVPGRYRGRVGGRAKLRGSGGQHTARAIEAGLDWLKDHQDRDGRWDCDEFMKHDQNGEPCTGRGDPLHDVGVTGLALLAFLGDGSTLNAGPYKDVIESGINWLGRQLDDDTGLIGTDASHHFIYDHMLATIALCEAYGLSEHEPLRSNAQNAIDYLRSHRNATGCWRYQPRGGDNDMSVTGWAVLAYVSAKEFGLLTDKKALEFADSYIDEMTDPNGRTGYSERGGLSSRHKGKHEIDFPADRTECMTAVGLLCKYFLGHDPKTAPLMTAQANVLAKKPPTGKKDEKGSPIDHYYWYYGTYAMYQVGGKMWNEWNKALNEAVLKTQRTDGNFIGSWDPCDAWGDDGGRIYSTAMLVLSLEAHYRYSRTGAPR